MDAFLEKMAELLEEDTVNPADELTSFEAWDSLTMLSIIALADEDFNKTVSAKQVQDAGTIQGLYDLLSA
jgi:acyl carrier protein